jgi:hypothetical protein
MTHTETTARQMLTDHLVKESVYRGIDLEDQITDHILRNLPEITRADFVTFGAYASNNRRYAAQKIAKMLTGVVDRSASIDLDQTDATLEKIHCLFAAPSARWWAQESPRYHTGGDLLKALKEIK